MSIRTTALRGTTAVAIAAALALSGCSGTESAPEVDPNAPVTITIGNKPPADQPESLKQFERQLAGFKEKYPNITVEAEETKWEADTFGALLAGGQLPTVFTVPFTETQGLIAREQVAEISPYLGEFETLSNINPVVMAQVKNAEDKVYGIPTGAYSMGLLYNRALFTEAGLDPDSPPKTWDEVRSAAKQISTSTDAQGFATMTLDNTGGWALTTTSYAMGGTLESEDGTQATVDNPATRQVLEMYRAMRWEDQSMGSNFLLNYDDAVNAFAGGKVGMYVMGADAYANMVVNKGMKADDFGLAPLPQASGGLGTLGGGSVAILKPDATPEQITAGLKLIDYLYFNRFSSEEAANADAKAAAADGGAIGAPALPMFNKELEDRYQGWIAEYVNVPRDHFTAYFESTQTMALVPEPPVKAQELYASLDPVVQAVLTRQDADIDALLGKAQTTVQSAIDAG